MADDPPPAADAAPLPGARLAVGLLLSINLLNYVDRYVLAAVVPRIRDEFHKLDPTLDNTKMGYLGSAFFVSYMLTAPVFGWLADRMRRWLLVGVGVLLWSVATGGSGLAGTFAVLLVARLFVGIGEAGYGPAAPTIIADLFPVARRGTVLAWFYVAIPVGSALGFVIGGKVSEHLGWRWAFYVVTIPGLLLGAWSLFMRDPPRGGSERTTSRSQSDYATAGDDKRPVVLDYAVATKPGLAAYAGLASNRSYLLNTAAMAAMTFAIGGISFWMPEYLIHVRGLSEGTVGAWFGAVLVVGGLLATLTGGWLGDRLRGRFGGSYFLVSGAGMLLACPFLLLMLRTPFPACWGVIFVAVFFLFFNTGPSNTALANVVHPNVRATAFAVNIFLIHLFGDAPASTVLGWVSVHYGWTATFVAVTAVMALAGVLWLCGAPHLARDTEAAPQGRST